MRGLQDYHHFRQWCSQFRVPKVRPGLLPVQEMRDVCPSGAEEGGRLHDPVFEVPHMEPDAKVSAIGVGRQRCAGDLSDTVCGRTPVIRVPPKCRSIGAGLPAAKSLLGHARWYAQRADGKPQHVEAHSHWYSPLKIHPSESG